MTSQAVVLTRLADLGVELTEPTEFVRTYAGPWQKRNGAWTWFIHTPGRAGRTYGSQATITELKRCSNWRLDASTYDVSVDPCGECPAEVGFTSA